MVSALVLALAISGDVEVTGFVSERLQLTAPSASSPSSTQDLPQLLSLTEASGLLRLRLLDEKLTVVVDASAFVFAQGGYADRDIDVDDKAVLKAVDDHDVPADPRVVFAEAYARYAPFDHLDLTLGKRRVVWGSGMSFNPTDVINPPRDPTDASLQRTGVPMAMVEMPFQGFALSAFFAPGILEEKNGIPSALFSWPDVVPQETLQNPTAFSDPRDEHQHWAAALRGYALVADTDVNVWALAKNEYGQDPRENALHLAFSLSRIFLEIHELHIETLVQQGSDRFRVDEDCVDDDADANNANLARCMFTATAPLARDRLDDDALLPRFLVGSRSMFGDGTTVSFEWLYQADGLMPDEWDDLVTLQSRVGTLVREGVVNPAAFQLGTDASGQPARLAVTPLRRHHLIASYMRPQIADDFTVTATAIVALEDGSALATASLAWQATEWLQLSAWGFAPVPSLARLTGNNNILWPSVVDDVAYGEYDAVPFTARAMLEARAWF